MCFEIRRSKWNYVILFFCFSCRNLPLEGLLKLFASLLICAICVYQMQNAQQSTERHQAIGQLTVFSLFALSSLCDIISEWCQRIIFPGLDYLLLVICFNVQSIVLSYHSVGSYLWISVADTCAMYAATFVAVALLLEFKYSRYVWFPLMRSFCTLVLGTWFIHIYIVLLMQSMDCSESVVDVQSLDNNTLDQDAVTVSLSGAANQNGLSVENLSLMPMYFTWHCLFDMNILTIMWVAVWKLSSKNCCICAPGEEIVNRFENRIHFDYHMITRMTDSDCEQ